MDIGKSSYNYFDYAKETISNNWIEKVVPPYGRHLNAW